MTTSVTGDSIGADLETIRERSPLIHNITNYVVMEFTANALLSVGASPVMAHSAEEVREMVALAAALVLNIGTLSPPWVESMLAALEVATERRIPVVLDPVGAGATPYRTATARRILEAGPPTLVRGNASEIAALGSNLDGTKGVDSTAESVEVVDAAESLSGRYGVAVVVSGATDLVLHGAEIATLRNGVPMMSRVTGMGCAATALTGAFLAVDPKPLAAGIGAMATMGIAAELAAEGAEGPGSLKIRWLDALHRIGTEDLVERLALEMP